MEHDEGMNVKEYYAGDSERRSLLHSPVEAVIPVPTPAPVPLVRDISDLEGTLLEPTTASSSSSQLPTAVPISFFEYDTAKEDEEVNEEALFVPSMDDNNLLNNPMRDKAQVDFATRKGKIQAELEVEDIQKGNRQVFAVNYYNKKEVARANQRAAVLNQEEEHQVMGIPTTTTTTTPSAELTPPPPPAAAAASTSSPPAAQIYPGTFGSDYEVSTYEVKSYQTNDGYQVSDYKSVYDP